VTQELTIYTVGKGFKSEDYRDLEVRIAALNADPLVRALCGSIAQEAERCLNLIHLTETGWGYSAKSPIPSDVDICFYSGTIRPRKLSSGSNHVIDLGTVIEEPLVVDGSPPAPSLARPGSMQMVNHKCSLPQERIEPAAREKGFGPNLGPNCSARHVATADGLGLWILRTNREIVSGEQLSFDYGGSFWSSGPHSPSKAGYTLVYCKCSKPRCPKDRWRWERNTYHSASRSHHKQSLQHASIGLRTWLVEGPPPRSLPDGDQSGPSPVSQAVAAGSTEPQLSSVDRASSPPGKEEPQPPSPSTGDVQPTDVEPLRCNDETDNLSTPLGSAHLVEDAFSVTGSPPQAPIERLTRSDIPTDEMDPAGPPPQRVLTLNVGPVGIRDSLNWIIPIFRSTPALVFIQEAKLPPRAVSNLKKAVHKLLPHYCLFVGKLPKDASDLHRHEVITFVHCHLAARATLLDISQQLNDSFGASRCDLHSRVQVLRTTDVQSKVNILWINVYGFQASEPTRQEAQWALISAVTERWQPQSDYTVIGGDFNASLSSRAGYRPDSLVHRADSLVRRYAESLGLFAIMPGSSTWSNASNTKSSTLDFFLSKAAPSQDGIPPVGPCLRSASTSESPDPHHDHKIVSGLLADGIVSPLPPLEDLRTPVRLRMGKFHAKREEWSRVVQERVEAFSAQPARDAFERLDQVKATILKAAHEVLGSTGGKLKPAIRFHSSESIRLTSLLRTVKAARRDILARKDTEPSAAPELWRPSRAMRAMWDRGMVPEGGSFAYLTNPFSEPHSGFTKRWLGLLRDTTARILRDLQDLRIRERKQAEYRSRSDAILRMYQGRGELRRFLHGADPSSPAPFLVSPLPDSVSFSCMAPDPGAIAALLSSIDSRLKVSLSMNTITVSDIPPSLLHSVLSSRGVSPGISCTSRGLLVNEAADRLSCWEFKLALDGMATRSRCASCRGHSILPVPHTQAQCRNIAFFCKACGAFRDVHVDPSDYGGVESLIAGPIPRVPLDAPERLAKPISREDLDWYLSTLPSHKAPGPDGVPYECLKFGPVCVKEAVLEAVNSILSRGSPMPLDWKGGLIRYLFKSGDMADMSNYRPVCLQDSVYKVLSAVLTDRLYRITEKYGLLADTQEGFRRLRSTTRQAQSLQWAIEDAAQRKESIYIAYLDFENAFNSIDHEPLWQWLEMIGIPDVDLLRSLYKDAYYTADFPYGKTAHVQLTRGKKQGDLISPLLFELTFNIYLLALEVTTKGSVRLFHKPKVGRGFADDVAIVSSHKSQLQARLDKTAQFCQWSGMRVKVIKTRLTAYDFGSCSVPDISGITYEGQEFKFILPREAFPYLGIRISLVGSFRLEREHVMGSVRELRDQVKLHRYNLDQMVQPIQSVASSRFRYSAPLVPWSDAQLDHLHAKWAGLSKASWKLPPSFPSAPLTFPPSHGGLPIPHPRVYLVQALATHIEQLVAFPDDLRERTIRQYRQLCSDTGCLTTCELTHLLSRERGPRPCPIARLLRVCGQLDLQIKLPDCLSLGPGEHETSWYRLLTCLREAIETSDVGARGDLETVERKWRALRLEFKTKGIAQPRALIDDAGASRPQWRVSLFTAPWLRPLYRLLQRIPPETRRQLFPPLDRGRRAVTQEVHQPLVSAVFKALRDPQARNSPLSHQILCSVFRDPRWTQVKCSERISTWKRLLTRHSLDHTLLRALAAFGPDPFLTECCEVIRDLCALGLCGDVPRQTLTSLLASIANGFTSPIDSPTGEPRGDEHPLRREHLRLSRDFISIDTEDPPESVVEVPPYRITTHHNKSSVTKHSDNADQPVHVGTVTQGRFTRLCSLFGQSRVLASLSTWIGQAESSERSRGVASAQFWSQLRQATSAIGYIGGPPLLLPPYFSRSIPSGDDRLKTPLPPQTYRPGPGRYIVDFLHKDAEFQTDMRVLLANPDRLELLVIARNSTMERDTSAMLARRFIQLHTFPSGSNVAAKKANWSRGAFDTVQSLEDWSFWVPRHLNQAISEEWRAALSSLTFTQEGIIPFDPSCPSLEETILGASGPLYTRGGVIAATDGSVKRDGSMGASVSWSRPDLFPFRCEVHGPPKSICPELVGVCAAPMYAPLEEDLTMLVDSKSSLLLLKGMQREDFPIFLHRRAERRLLERVVSALNLRAAAGSHTHLAKVKAHSGDPLNSIADYLASRATGQDYCLDTLDSETVYFYLRNRPVAWSPKLREHLCLVAAGKSFEKFSEKRVSRDHPLAGRHPPQPGTIKLMNYTESWLVREGQGRSMLGQLLNSMEIGLSKRRILQTIAGTFPCRALLHKWGRADSPKCPLCDAATETQCHVQCLCPQLREARIAAHHQIATCLWSEITEKQESKSRHCFTWAYETRVDEIRNIASIPPSSAPRWRSLWDAFFSTSGASSEPLPADMARLRPDAVAIRWDKRRMFLLEVTRPYDSRSDFASRPHLAEKLSKYQAVAQRFMAVAQNWQVSVIPFTVGVRGSIDVIAWKEHLDALGVAPAAIPRLIRNVMSSALSALDTIYDARSYALRDDSHLARHSLHDIR